MKILIRLPNWLGDAVMSTAFIATVKELYPDALIDVILKKELSGIATLIPGLHNIYPFSKQEYKGLGGVFRFGKNLRSEKYDLFFNLPTSLSSLVLGWATGAKKRIGFGKEGGFFMLTNSYKKPQNVHRVDEYVSMLEQFTNKTISNRQVKLDIPSPVQLNKNRALINFNSEALSRRMPLDKAKTIISLLTNTFISTTFTFIGSPKEAAFIEQVIGALKIKTVLKTLPGKRISPG